jgi:hypothetical protein
MFELVVIKLADGVDIGTLLLFQSNLVLIILFLRLEMSGVIERSSYIYEFLSKREI